MFTSKHAAMLKSIGLFIEVDTFRIYQQGKPNELLYEIPFNTVKGIKISKTESKRYSKSIFGWLIIGRMQSEPMHAPVIYQLSVLLFSGNVKYSYLSDFDLITATAAIKELNFFIQNEN